jgi:DHA3 family tetracycline resistance protein-like MFS transporter
MVACLLFNAFETAGTIVWATIKQRHVPASMLGRVSSLDWLISIGLLPLSFALTAPVGSVVGVRATLIGAAAIGGVFTLAALFLPGMRDIEGTGTATEVDAERKRSARNGEGDLLRPPAFVDVRS